MKKLLSIILSVSLSMVFLVAEPQQAHASGSIWLVVIGGGASGGRSESQGHRSGAGGGGAGAYYENTAYTISASGSTTITIGAGGTSVTNTGGAIGNIGATTTFGTLEVNGGAGGGFHSDGDPSVTIGDGQDGTSAGGASCCAPSWYGGSTTPSVGVGYDGGTANGSDGGGGGGGAGGRGANTSGSAVGGNGGTGVSSSISGSSVCRAGGGAGGSYTSTGGSATCGGGAGGNNNAPGTSATANTGGGGGGGGGTNSGASNINSGAGGSGVVILAYKKDGSDGISTSTGGTITSDATYWIHTFTTSGSWNPTLSSTEVPVYPRMKLEGDISLGGDVQVQ